MVYKHKLKIDEVRLIMEYDIIYREEPCWLSAISIYYIPTSGLLQILPCDWLCFTHLSNGDISLVAKGVDFHIRNNCKKLAFSAQVSIHLFNISLFYPTSWSILKQLDNSQSSSMSDSQVGCALLNICSFLDNSGSLSNC